MLSTKRCSTVLALAALAAVASAQVDTKTFPGGADPGNGRIAPAPKTLNRDIDPIGKIGPVTDNSGKPLCFGDGSGLKCPSRNNGKAGHGCNNSANLGGALLWADGNAKIGHDTIALHVRDLPAPTTAIFLQAEGCRNNELGMPFGDGLMCLGRSTMRLGAIKVRDHATFPPPGRHVGVSEVGHVSLKGGERYYQVLYRDPQPFGTPGHGQFNLSNAWSIVWAP